MIILSLLANILILVPTCWVILKDGDRANAIFGPKNPARNVLIAIYIAVLGFSIVLLALHLSSPSVLITHMILTILGFQVAYKLLTVVTLGLGSSIAIANLGVVAVHVVTLVMHG